MTCRELIEFLMAYLDGELPDGQRAVFEEHLAGCPQCVAYLGNYRAAVALGKAACTRPEEGAADTVPEALIRAILAARGSAGR